MREHKAHFTSPLISLDTASADCLNKAASSTDEDLHRDGAISKDGTLSWLYSGACLEVLNSQNGGRVAAWCFGAILKDSTTVVTCCTEFKPNCSASLLVVGTQSSTANMLVLFDIKSARVSKAIQMPHTVTSVEVVSSVGADQSPEHALSPHLLNFSGILAVGTLGAHIYLIDMNLDDETPQSDEVRPAALRMLNIRSRDVAGERYQAQAHGQHLCLELGEDAHRRSYFYYKKPDDQTIKYYPEDDVSVSKMAYLTQTGQLAVGYSFGCFQLWRLLIPVLEYSSRFEEDLAAVTHFAFQEPENDPRNFCYLWIARGPQPHQHQVDYNSVISLYQMGFNKKTWYDGFGYHFEEVTSVGPRFEHELTTDPYNLTEGVYGSRLVSCATLLDPMYKLNESRAEMHHDSFEGCGGRDQSLCVMVWEAGYGEAEPSCHLALFDINRWYHAQMPHAIRAFSGHQEACSFFAFYSLSDVVDACIPAGLIDVHVPFNSLSKFHSVAIPAPEQHFFPSSMAFDSCFLAENGLVQSKYLGIQRTFLTELQTLGADAIADPTNMYNKCLYAGLLPRHMDSTSLQVHKREAILSAALDYGLLSFINSCITQFGSGELISRGCSLRVLGDWAWKCVTHAKTSLDKLSVSLFDWSGVPLDSHSLQLLHQQLTCLERLCAIFSNLLNQPATDIGREDLETRTRVCSLIQQHVKMILWFYSVGLLPEHSEEEGDGLSRYSYPGKVLKEAYSSRRAQIRKLHAELSSADVLHVDGMMARAGESLKQLLANEGRAEGLYPFPNFHCLLAMFLLEDVPLDTKQTLVFYALYDLCALLPETLQQEFNDKMQLYTQMFAIPTGVQKFVQAIWLLDHKDFEDALAYLLDPTLDMEIEPWQHTITIKALLYQTQYSLALKYVRVRKPPLYTPEDVKLRLTVLLANGLTSEAFEYQRMCRDQHNADDLLSHLFTGSQQTRTVDSLLQLPLAGAEEQQLVTYLTSNSSQLQAQELLLMYYLQRARFVEAIRLNNKIKQTFKNDMDVGARERAMTRNSIVEGYMRVLPRVQRQLAFHGVHDGMVQKRTTARRQFARPRPLSMSVNKRATSGQPVTRASLLREVLSKARQVQSAEMYEEELPPASIEEEMEKEPGPFICTPLTPQPNRAANKISENLVFPANCSLHVMRESLASPLVPKLTAMRQNITATRLSSSPMKDISSLSDTLRNRRRLTQNADLSLLQTPPVKRKSPRRHRLTPDHAAPVDGTTPGTPHSILKVRRDRSSLVRTSLLPRRSPSPQLYAQRSSAELALPTPPVLSRSLRNPQLNSIATSSYASPLTTKTHLSSTTSTALANTTNTENTGTPKHLRFSMPGGVIAAPAKLEEREEENVEESEEDVTLEESEMEESMEEANPEVQREATPPPPTEGWRTTPERETEPAKIDEHESYEISEDEEIIVNDESEKFDDAVTSPVKMADVSGNSGSDHSPLQRRPLKDVSPKGNFRHSLNVSGDSNDFLDAEDEEITFNVVKQVTTTTATVTTIVEEQDDDTEPLNHVSTNMNDVIDVEGNDVMEKGQLEAEISIKTTRDLSDNEEMIDVDDSTAAGTQDDEQTDRFAAFGTGLTIEVGVSRIDETSMVMKESPRKSPRMVSPKNMSPKKTASPKIVSPKKSLSPKSSSPKKSPSPKKLSPKKPSPKQSPQKETIETSPKNVSHGKESLNLQLDESPTAFEEEEVDIEQIETDQQMSSLKDFVEENSFEEQNDQDSVSETSDKSIDVSTVVEIEREVVTKKTIVEKMVNMNDVSVVISPASQTRAQEHIKARELQPIQSDSIKERIASDSVVFQKEQSITISQSSETIETYQSTISSGESLTTVSNISHSTENVNVSHAQTENSNNVKETNKETPVTDDVDGTNKSHSKIPTRESRSRKTSVKEVTKEAADSSDSQPPEPKDAHENEKIPTEAVRTEAETTTKPEVEATKPESAPKTPTRRGRASVAEASASAIITPPRPHSIRKTKKDTVNTPRRSSRLHPNAEEQDESGFKTPPRPTRLAMPPTPPESSPASTTSQQDVSVHTPAPDTSVNTTSSSSTTRSLRTRKAVTAAPKRGRKTRARSRSSSPPVVSSTTNEEHVVSMTTEEAKDAETNIEQLEPGVEMESEAKESSDAELSSGDVANDKNTQKKTTPKKGRRKSAGRSREVVAATPLGEDSSIMSLRSGKRLSLSRDGSPGSRDTSLISRDASEKSRDSSTLSRDTTGESTPSRTRRSVTRGKKSISRDVKPVESNGSILDKQDDEGFTFSAPQAVQDIGEEFMAVTTEDGVPPSFVFSPPLTRGLQRRQSMSSAPSPASSLIGLLPPGDKDSNSIGPANNKRTSVIGSKKEEDGSDVGPVTEAASPPKKARGRPKKSTSKSRKKEVVDSPINFIPEVNLEDEDSGSKRETRRTRMTLRTRAQPPPFLERKRVRSIQK